MKPRVLFLVTTDPRTSPRPAEAVRIATGVGGWDKTEVSVYLREAAVLALGEEEELVDGDTFSQYLPVIQTWGRPVYVQRSALWLAALEESRVPFEPIDDEQLSALVAESQYVVRF
jgi:sulfur relay (sulfurtransferase) DsrF/TusC family protein